MGYPPGSSGPPGRHHPLSNGPASSSGSHAYKSIKESSNNPPSPVIGSFRNRALSPPRSLPLVTLQFQDELLDRIHGLFGDEFRDMAINTAKYAKEQVEYCVLKMRDERSVDQFMGLPLHSRRIYQFTGRAVFFVKMPFQYNLTEKLPTVLLVAKEWTPASAPTWQLIVENVKRYIDDRVAQVPEAEHLNIAVEMVSADLMRKKYIAPLDIDELYPRIETSWPAIKDEIFNIGQRHDPTSGNITSVAIFKLGFDPHGRNPRTVYVSVSYESPEQLWDPVAKEMKDYLDTLDLNLHLQLEHNEIDHQAFDLLPMALTKEKKAERKNDFIYQRDRTYTTEVIPGADISVAQYLTRSDDNKMVNPPAGTFGCWLELTLKDGRGKRIVGLTNYHVIRPAIEGFSVRPHHFTAADGQVITTNQVATPQRGSLLRVTDEKGFWANQGNTYAKVEHPARVKHNFSVAALNEEIQAVKPSYRAEREQKLAKHLAFFDSGQHILGKPYLGSGYMERTKNNGRLDFALILPEDAARIGGNPIDVNQFLQKYPAQFCPERTVTQIRNMRNSMEQMSAGHRLYMIGASTTCTIGEYSRLKMDVVIKEGKYMGRRQDVARSGEFLVIGIDPNNGDPQLPFGLRGDSGSVVWDEDGCIMGLLFTGRKPHQCEVSYSLVTPIEDVFDGIKKMSRGEIVDVQVLGS